MLVQFRLRRSHITMGGGRKSPVAAAIDSEFYNRGWEEKAFATSMVVDDDTTETPTHKVDCFKSRVALEVEWNNKDPFYDRDLNNLRCEWGLAPLHIEQLAATVIVDALLERDDTLMERRPDAEPPFCFGRTFQLRGNHVVPLRRGGELPAVVDGGLDKQDVVVQAPAGLVMPRPEVVPVVADQSSIRGTRTVG